MRDFPPLTEILDGCKSIMIFAVPYVSELTSENLPLGFGRIARYSMGRDYHKVIRKRLNKILGLMKEISEVDFNFRAFADAVPIMERPLAKNALGGFIGKNSLHIIPQFGSFHFLAEVLTTLCPSNLRILVEEYNKKIKDELLSFSKLSFESRRTSSCGDCQRCMNSCPTGAIVSPYTVNASKCISYLTIEHVGVFNDWQRKAVSNWIFGCDICQEVCPFNASIFDRSIPEEFLGEGTASLNLENIIEIPNNQSFLNIFAGTPMMRPGRSGLIRNALAVIGNQKASALMSSVSKLRSDSDPIISYEANICYERLNNEELTSI